jgi:hypothetical protein
MYNYGELELLILSCIWIKPELLKTTKLQEKHFVYNKKIFLFFKSFYEKFGFFDNELACKKASNRYKYNEYIKVIANLEPTISNFEKYVDLLLELYNESKEENYLREKVFELANDLYMKNINSKEFKERLDNLYSNVKEICEK